MHDDADQFDHRAMGELASCTNIKRLAEALFAALRTVSNEERPAPPRLMYTTAEAATITGLPERWLKEQSATGQVPSRKVGHYRLFSWDDLVAIVEAHAKPPTSGPMARTLQKRVSNS